MIRIPTSFQGRRCCETVLQYESNWRHLCAILIGYARVSTSTGYEVRIFLLPGHVQILLSLIAGLPFLPYAKMFVCERCLAKNAEGTMTKYWAFARGGATGGPYICEQCRLDARSGNDGTLILQTVTIIELAPTDVYADSGARLLEERKVKDRA